MPDPLPVDHRVSGARGGDGLVGKTPSSTLAILIPIPTARTGWKRGKKGGKKGEGSKGACRRCWEYPQCLLPAKAPLLGPP